MEYSQDSKMTTLKEYFKFIVYFTVSPFAKNLKYLHWGHFYFLKRNSFKK